MGDAKEVHESRHPEYVSKSGEWHEYAAAYEGGKAFSQRALVAFPAESHERFKFRSQHTFPINYVSFVVDAWASYLSNGVAIDGDELLTVPVVNRPDEPQPFANDMDRRGSDLATIMRRSASLGALHGTVVLYTDMPQVVDANGNRTMADDLAEGIRPYLTPLPPTELLDWGMDDRGGLDWALLKAGAKDRRLAPGNMVIEEAGPSFVLWTRGEWFHLSEKGDVINSGVNKIGEVPVTIIAFKPDPQGGSTGVSIVRDIVPLNVELINVFSLLMVILYNQTFSMLALPEDSQVGNVEIDEETGLQKQVVSVGAHSVFRFKDVPPQFFSPDASQGGLLIQSISILIAEILRSANLAKGTARIDGAASDASGVSKAFDFLDLNQALKDAAKALKSGFESALYQIALWLGVDGADPKIEFPSDFGVTGANELIAAIQQLALAGPIPPLMLQELLIRVAQQLLPGLTDSEMEAVIDDIKGQLFEPGRELVEARMEESDAPPMGDEAANPGSGSIAELPQDMTVAALG